MQQESTREPKQRMKRGRPRSQRSKRAVLRSAARLIRRKPAAAVSVADVARDAGVSTATIYRWWRKKEDLLMDAIAENAAETLRFPKRRSPLASVRAQITNGSRFLATPEGQLYLRFVTRGGLDTKTRDVFYKRFQEPLYTECIGLLKEAQLAGELPALAPLPIVYDLLNGPLFVRTLLEDTDLLSASYINRIFDVIVAGLWERFG